MPPAVYPTLRDVFLERVIRIYAVQRERPAAIDEARNARMKATEEDVTGQPEVTVDDIEQFFDFGILLCDPPRPLQLYRGEMVRAVRSPCWPITTDEPSIAPDKLTALERAMLVALSVWRQLVRDLRSRKLVVSGEKIEAVMSAFTDRREIGPETWLSDNLWFDVRDNTICTRKHNVGFGRRVVQLWVEIRAQGANEASEFENARADAAETQETAGGAAREPQPSDEAERGQQAARRGGRPRENEWAAWVDYVAEDIAKNGPLGRKKGKFVLSRAVQLGLDFFPPPQPSAAAIYKWLKAHPDEWQPRWGVKPEEYDEPTGP